MCANVPIHINIHIQMQEADIVCVRFGDKYRQWNAAFDAGYAAAKVCLCVCVCVCVCMYLYTYYHKRQYNHTNKIVISRVISHV